MSNINRPVDLPQVFNDAAITIEKTPDLVTRRLPASPIPDNSIRDTMIQTELPTWFKSRLIQKIITIMTGKPHTGQDPFDFSPWYFLITIGVLPVLFGVAIGWIAT